MASPSSITLSTPSTPTPPPFSSPSVSSFPAINQTLTIRLNSMNYLVWKTQILHIVTANGLANMLDGSCPSPPPILDNLTSQQNPEFLTWQRYNSLIISWIFSSMSEELLPQFVAFSTASELWTALATRFASSSMARITDLRNQLLSISKDGLSATAYIQKLTSLCNTLAAIGQSVPYQDHLLYFLGGLGSEYNPFVTSITNRADQPPLEEIYSLLQSYDFRLEKQNSSLALPAPAQLQANAVFQRPYRPQWQPRIPTPPRPTFPSGPSPFGSFNPPHSQPWRQPRPTGSFKPKCQICGKMGHTALKCFHLHLAATRAQPYANLSTLAPPSSHSAQPSSILSQSLTHLPFSPSPIQTPNALSAGLLPTPSSQSPDSSWILDSGATHHFAKQSDHLQHLQSLPQPSQVATAEGSDYIQGPASWNPS